MPVNVRRSISLWNSVRPVILLTDDTAARLAAGNLQIPTYGTIGVIVRAIRQGRRSRMEVIRLLRSLPISSSLHLKQQLLDRVIAEVEGASQ